MPNPEAMTDPAGAVERLRLALFSANEDFVSGGGAFPVGVTISRADADAIVRERGRLLFRITELEKALEPFAAVHDDYVDHFGDTQNDDDRMLGRIPREGKLSAPFVTWSDLRAAARASAKKKGMK